MITTNIEDCEDGIFAAVDLMGKSNVTVSFYCFDKSTIEIGLKPPSFLFLFFYST